MGRKVRACEGKVVLPRVSELQALVKAQFCSHMLEKLILLLSHLYSLLYELTNFTCGKKGLDEACKVRESGYCRSFEYATRKSSFFFIKRYFRRFSNVGSVPFNTSKNCVGNAIH